MRIPLHRLGFERVNDVNLVADITIMEEDSELVGWIEYGSKLPMITCCSRGWINCTET